MIPQMATSNSWNESIKSSKSIKSKNTQSLIPRSKSKKRTESFEVMGDSPLKAKYSKEKPKKVLKLGSEKSSRTSADKNSDIIQPPKEDTTKTSDSCEVKTENAEELISKQSLTVLKTSDDIIEDEKEDSDSSFKDVQECLLLNIERMSVVTTEDREIQSPEEEPKNTENEEQELENQQSSISNLDEIVKINTEPVPEELKNPEQDIPKIIPVIETEICRPDIAPSKVTEEYINSSSHDLESNCKGLQDQYDLTLKEISSIWKNAISLIGSVKDHTEKFVEENNALFDNEQLTLEEEMLQLAIDYAINYSKLKMDFLVASLQNHCNGKYLEKSELEVFVESRAYVPAYNNEDLAAMAQTVQDLNYSVTKGEDFEFE